MNSSNSCLFDMPWFHVQLLHAILMKLGMQVGLSPGHIVLNGDPAPPPKKRPQQLPQFRPMYIVAKRLDGSRCQLVRR